MSLQQVFLGPGTNSQKGQVSFKYKFTLKFNTKWHIISFRLVAAFLYYNVFTIFGPPTILHSDNGKEFVAKLIKQLVALWPGLKIINGRPRYPQSQGLIERGNATLQSKLSKWMEDNKSTEWSVGIPLVLRKYISFNIIL